MILTGPFQLVIFSDSVSPLLASPSWAGVPLSSWGGDLVREEDAHLQSPQAFPTRALQTRLILHEVPLNVMAFVISCSSARADDDEGVNNNNNIFYLYHTFKIENETSVQFAVVLLLAWTVVMRRAGDGG